MEARMPEVGEVLIHRYRRREGEVRVEVVSVDPTTRSVSVQMNGEVYASLSAAAKVAAGGTSQNRLDLLGPQEAGGQGPCRVIHRNSVQVSQWHRFFRHRLPNSSLQ